MSHGGSELMRDGQLMMERISLTNYQRGSCWDLCSLWWLGEQTNWETGGGLCGQCGKCGDVEKELVHSV